MGSGAVCGNHVCELGEPGVCSDCANPTEDLLKAAAIGIVVIGGVGYYWFKIKKK
jgi:hypothetical protein